MKGDCKDLLSPNIGAKCIEAELFQLNSWVMPNWSLIWHLLDDQAVQAVTNDQLPIFLSFCKKIIPSWMQQELFSDIGEIESLDFKPLPVTRGLSFSPMKVVPIGLQHLSPLSTYIEPTDFYLTREILS